MGMYTEFIFGAELSKDTPKVCLDALDFIINGEEGHSYDIWDKELNKRVTVKYERTTSKEELDAFIDNYDFWGLFRCSSYYFGGANPIGKFYYDDTSKKYRVSSRADCKNYNDQIEKFIEYITPYVTQGSGYEHTIFAYVQYEEDEFPTIYGVDGEYHVNDPELYKQYKMSLSKRWKLLEKLYKELCPDYEITEKELNEHNIKPEELTYEQGWELMIEHIIKKYKK